MKFDRSLAKGETDLHPGDPLDAKWEIKTEPSLPGRAGNH